MLSRSGRRPEDGHIAIEFIQVGRTDVHRWSSRRSSGNPRLMSWAWANITAYARLAPRRRRESTRTVFRSSGPWSVQDLEGFQESVWHYFRIKSSEPYTRVLESRAMPGRQAGSRAPNSTTPSTSSGRGTRRDCADHEDRVGRARNISWAELERKTAAFAISLKAMAPQRGQGGGVPPNIPETIVAFLASPSIGAIWSSCVPTLGRRAR